MQNYDLILVLNYCRPLTYYFSIIKYLRRDFKIGLFRIPLTTRLEAKHGVTHKMFVENCIDFGAEVVEGEAVSGKVVLYPQWSYEPEAVQLLREKVLAQRKLGALTLAWPGLHDVFLDQFEIQKVFVVHKRFFDFLLKHRGSPSIYEDREIVEVGLPFKNYPIFHDLGADYILAMPTPFSFPHEKDKRVFLETVFSLLEKIDPYARVIHKPHNAMDYDHFSGKAYRTLARFLRILPNSIILSLFKKMASKNPGCDNGHVGKLFTAYLYEGIMDRVIPMKKVISYHNFALEAFLPSVRKGVIGGLSNTIWGALFFELPYYNCVDMARQDRSTKNSPFKNDPSQLLDLNLKFFHVPYCHGRLEFDRRYFDIVDESVRKGDLIGELRKELLAI